ncbi:MAG: response regulator [Planctomycetes bacterium]|nr:response regulator [Planctomycetota bacterium]
MKTILLVEDDKNQLLLYKQELLLEGYNIITAQDGQEAIKKVKEHTPDLIVMDINMPKMSGIESMGRILSEHKSSDITELKDKIKELIGKS